MKTKIGQLIDIAMANNGQVCNDIKAKNLKRLDDGDLSHVGDALIKGLRISFDGHLGASLSFSGDTEAYTIIKPTIMIGNVECVAPESEPLNVGDGYFTLSLPELGVLEAVWRDDDTGNNRLSSGLVWLNKDDTQQAADAIKKLLTSANK